MKERIKDFRSAFHRNGICGGPFTVCLFRWKDDEGRWRDMHAVLFDERGMCAVFDVAELAQGNIAFAHGNSWQGDHFEYTLRDLIAKSEG